MAVDKKSEKFNYELQRFLDNDPPSFIKNIQIEDGNFLLFSLQFSKPYDEVLVHVEEKYRTHYPHGTVTFCISSTVEEHYNKINNNATATISKDPLKSSAVVRSMPGACGPTFEKICESLASFARIAGADGESVYARKIGIQQDGIAIQQISSSSSSSSDQTKNIGSSIEDLFPINPNNNERSSNNTENHLNNLCHDNDNNNNQFMTMMSSRSSSAVMMHARQSSNNNNYQRNNNNNKKSSSSMMARADTNAADWYATATMDVDVTMESVKLNDALIDDISRVRELVWSKDATSSPVDISSLDAGMISISFSFTPKELAQNIIFAKLRRIFREEQCYSRPEVKEALLDWCSEHDNSLNPKMKTPLDNVLESHEMHKEERFIFKFVVDPVQYPLGPIRVEFGQTTNFLNGVFPGAIGQVRRILNSFILSEQRIRSGHLDEKIAASMRNGGFSEEEVKMALADCDNDVEKANKKLELEYSAQVSGSSNKEESASKKSPAAISEIENLQARKRHPPHSEGLFAGCVLNFAQRLPCLTSSCCICDRPHVFAVSSFMSGITVCTRSSCQFRFSKLDVAKDVASSSALQTGVIDLLINLTRAAAMSDRHHLILDPFPTLYDPSTGKEVCSDKKKDIELVRKILDKFPMMKRLASAESQASVQNTLRDHHPLALSMFNFIVSSNKAVLIKLPQEFTIPFMKCNHQFKLIMQCPQREEEFQRLKKMPGVETLYSLHGSGRENWYRILRTGLVNASTTVFKVNGAAYGLGIYNSPNSGTASSYSRMYGGSGDASSAAAEARHMKEDYIDPFAGTAQVQLIAICEVLKKDLQMNNDIWVQKHETHIVTRFLFVYTHDHQAPHDIDLTHEDKKKILNHVLNST